jgi:hypothetical protein
VTIDLDELVERFRRLPGAKVGDGPGQPERVERFLDEYPFLRTDLGYVAFLRRYSGASIESDDLAQLVDIFGFGDASTDIEEMDGPVLTGDGFLIFAQCVYRVLDGGVHTGTREHDFAFDSAEGGRPGVYRFAPGGAGFAWYGDGFLAWLADLVERDGWLDR